MIIDRANGFAEARVPLRRVHRAASDLRRGVPVLIQGSTPLLVLAAETAGIDALIELQELSNARPVLVLSPARAAAILRSPMQADAKAVAIAFPEAMDEVEAYRSFADPTMPEPAGRETLREVSAPGGADVAIGLAKIARLLPAILAAPVAGEATARIAARGVLEVDAADVTGYGQTEVAGLQKLVSAEVPLDGAPDSRVVAFRAHGSAVEHLAVVIGRPEDHAAPLVRIHSECFTGDLLGSMRCDCGEQLRGAIRRMSDDGAGILLYLAQEGRGIGLVNKLRAYRLQDRGFDTMDANQALGWGADERNFMIGAMMLRLLGIQRIRLLTNNPDKVDAMNACGITVLDREPILFAPNGVNDEYLATKAGRLRHILD